MRLSWYGDSGVAVLSIWQGDRCSGTFRLPADELSRMVDTLRRGPDRDEAAPRELPPPGPGYPGSAPEIYPSDPLGLDYRSAETAGYRDGSRPDQTGAHRSADDSRTDLGPAVADLPVYLAAPGRDYRPGDPEGYPAGDRQGYPAADIRGYPADDRQGYPAADSGGHPAPDPRVYAPGARPGYRPADGGPVGDDRAAEAYPSWAQTDSGAHARSGGWPEDYPDDYPDDESLPRGREPSGPRQDRPLAEDRRGRSLLPRPASRAPRD